MGNWGERSKALGQKTIVGKERGIIKPLVIMIGSAIVTVGVLAYPASLYICGKVYDRQMEILKAHYGPDVNPNVEINYKETANSFTGRSGEFTVTYYETQAQDENDNQSHERKKLVDLRFTADTSFGYLGFTSDLSPDKEYGDFPEIAKIVPDFPSIVTQAHYKPWNDRIDYQSNIGAFDLFFEQGDTPKTKLGYKAKVAPLTLELEMDRNGRFTKLSDAFSKIEKGERDFSFSILGSEITLNLTGFDKEVNGQTQIDFAMHDFKYSGSMIGGVSTSLKTELKDFTIRTDKTNTDLLGFRIENNVLRNGDTYGIGLTLNADQLSFKDKEQDYTFNKINVDSALVNMDKTAFIPIIYLSDQGYMEKLVASKDAESLLDKEAVFDAARDIDYQWDLRDLSFETNNGAKASINGHVKAVIFSDEEDRNLRADLDFNFEKDVVATLFGKSATNYVDALAIAGYLKPAAKASNKEDLKDKSSEAGADKNDQGNKKAYTTHVSYKNRSILINGKQFPGLN